MNNPQRTPQQEPDVSIYDPECVVNSPHIIAEWLNNIDFAPNNNDKYLEETIQSVLNQSYKEIEYIIVDGGSEDNTINIIRKYSNQID